MKFSESWLRTFTDPPLDTRALADALTFAGIEVEEIEPAAPPFSGVLVGEVLSSGKTSRLYRALVYDQRIATEVAASQNSRELGSFFQIVATAAPGRTLAEVERAIAKELAGFLDRGPTAA